MALLIPRSVNTGSKITSPSGSLLISRSAPNVSTPSSIPTASLVQSQQSNLFQQAGNFLGTAIKSWQQAPIVGGAVKQMIDIKPNEGLGAGLGRVMQKVPSPNLGTKGKDIFKATETETNIIDFLSNMPSVIVNSWGKSLETLSTPEGKKQLKEGAKNLPNTVKEVKDALINKEWGKAFQIALDNPAISVAMDVSDFIPIIWLGKAGLTGIKASLRKTGQQIVKEGVEEAGFKTVKEVFESVKVPEVPKALKAPKVETPIVKGLEGGVKVEPKTVEVPKEQLPVGEGAEKVSRLEARIQGVTDKLTKDDIDRLGVATYNEVKNKENIRLASEYIVKNPEDGLKILKGEIEPPKGILRNAVYLAMEQSAKDDITLATKLASLSSTRAGQEISILRELDPSSPVKIASDIFKIKEEVFKKRYSGREPREFIKNMAEKGRKEIKAPTKLEWGSLIKEIKCK